MARYGIPDIVVSNNGSQFSLTQFKAFTTVAVGWLVMPKGTAAQKELSGLQSNL